jgi:hypothetical protein
MKNKLFIKVVLIGLVMAVFTIFWGISKDTIEAKTVIYEIPEITKVKSLCVAKEQIIWTCTTTKNKIASVCASKNLTAEKGYVQYRFGSIGKVELELPKSQTGSQKFFKYSRYTRPLVTMLSLTFENNGFNYEIHDDDNSEEKPPVQASSIDVTNGDKSSSINCRQPTYGSLMKLEDIVPKNEN